VAARFAAFIDAGFLRAGAATALARRSHEVDVDGAGLMTWLRAFRAYDLADELLRAYWYDGAFDPSHTQYAAQRRLFDALDSVPGLELRLGHLVERRPKWHRALEQALDSCGVDRAKFNKQFAMKFDLVQKGVDTIITMDLIRHSQSRNYDWALLIAGDRDLVDPVRSVQDDGRRVVVAAPERAGVAIQLRRRADMFVTIDTQALRTFVKRRRPSASATTAQAS
jgi:uncharacterized LabA/DUF88 family protein